jgi:hypothetical protein
MSKLITINDWQMLVDALRLKFKESDKYDYNYNSAAQEYRFITNDRKYYVYVTFVYDRNNPVNYNNSYDNYCGRVHFSYYSNFTYNDYEATISLGDLLATLGQNGLPDAFTYVMAYHLDMVS